MIDQLFIGLFGVTAIFLANCKSIRLRKFACLCGAASQPFWFYTTWTHRQFGIFGLTFLYSSFWLMGVWNEWLRPWVQYNYEPRFEAQLGNIFGNWWLWRKYVPLFRYGAREWLWSQMSQTYSQKRELYVLWFNWELHWTWRVTP